MTTTRTGQFRFPGLDADETAIREFRQHHFAPFSRYRNIHMERINRALWYVIGKQWAELDTDTIAEGARGFALREMQEADEIDLPRPVTNLIAPSVDVEFATLSKRQWVPKIPTYSRDPRQEAQRKVAQDVLSDRLKKLQWEDKRDQFILDVIIMGTGTFHSYWDASFFETTWNGVPNPIFCPSCQKLYASAQIPATFLPLIEQGQIPDNSMEHLLETTDEVELQNCPYCAGPFDPIALAEQDSYGTDVFGRPLGNRTPKGQTALELISPFEYFPQNAGIGLTPDTIHQHGICRVRSLDWVEEHYPDYIDKVEPEDPTELMKHHPLLGDWDILGRFDYSLDAGMYDHHVRVYDLFADPSYRFPKGRAITILGDRQQLVVRNEALIRDVTFEGKTLSVQTDLVTSAIWKPRRGEFWGKHLPDDLFSPQNRVNGIDAQVIEARERMGSPNLLVPGDAVDFKGPEWRTSYGLGKIMSYEPNAINPNAKPEPFGGVTMPSGVNLERDRAVESFTKIVGPADIEIGEAPRNITTTSGLQILGEQAERRRATRERGIVSAIQKVWQHQLDMLWTLRVDEDSYEAEKPDGSWEVNQYTRASMGDRAQVEIEKQAFIDRSIIDRERAMEAYGKNLYDLSTPYAKKKFLDFVGLPSDINEDTNLQISHAQRMWVDFVDHQAIPVIDLALDDPTIRYHVLGTMLLQDEGRRISEAAGWPKLLPILAGWEDEYTKLAALDAQTRQQYGGEPTPEQAAAQYAQMQMAYDDAQSKYDIAVQAAQAAGQPVDPNLQPPTAPPPPVFLPQQPEQRVYLVWKGILQRKGQPDPATIPTLDSYLRFRAVFEAYRLLSPPTPAPGSTPTPGGGPMPTAAPGMQVPPPPPTSTAPPSQPTPVGA